MDEIQNQIDAIVGKAWAESEKTPPYIFGYPAGYVESSDFWLTLSRNEGKEETKSGQVLENSIPEWRGEIALHIIPALAGFVFGIAVCTSVLMLVWGLLKLAGVL